MLKNRKKVFLLEYLQKFYLYTEISSFHELI